MKDLQQLFRDLEEYKRLQREASRAPLARQDARRLVELAKRCKQVLAQKRRKAGAQPKQTQSGLPQPYQAYQLPRSDVRSPRPASSTFSEDSHTLEGTFENAPPRFQREEGFARLAAFAQTHEQLDTSRRVDTPQPFAALLREAGFLTLPEIPEDFRPQEYQAFPEELLSKC